LKPELELAIRSRMNELKGKICVFTGSRQGARSTYVEVARCLGRALVRRHYGLVYGGGKVGLMGVIADTVLALGGHVTGVIPDALVTKEVAHEGLSELRIVKSMHERKAVMAELADGFIAMPGGIGTMEEFFEVLSWAQLGIHNKPCALLDAAGYYQPLIRFLDHAVAEDFLTPKHRALLLVEKEAEELLERIDVSIATHAAQRFDAART
jgi:uncharacterized protein (TIGR00730 family)